MKGMFKGALAIAALVGLGLASSAKAGSVTVTSILGTEHDTTALTNSATFGDDMVGMTVTAYFFGGGSETAIWGATGVGAGGAFGTGWSLIESGDTYNSNWTLTSSPLISTLVLDGAPGLTIFDRTSPSPGTPGSSIGNDFNPTSGAGAYDITAMYIDHIGLIPNPPVDDVYRFLAIDFTNTPFTGQMTFIADADNAVTSLVPTPAAVYPATVGLLALAAFRRRATK